ncbi:MAG: hypothetical protein DI568_08185 [Sphingomonas sp.]|nr:MAG: hypothetical protein DI568_08185 [Sphingomonas sp.]
MMWTAAEAGVAKARQIASKSFPDIIFPLWQLSLPFFGETGRAFSGCFRLTAGNAILCPSRLVWRRVRICPGGRRPGMMEG